MNTFSALTTPCTPIPACKISNKFGNSQKRICLTSASVEIHPTAYLPTILWILSVFPYYSCCPIPLVNPLPLYLQYLKMHIPNTQLLCIIGFIEGLCLLSGDSAQWSKGYVQNWNFYLSYASTAPWHRAFLMGPQKMFFSYNELVQFLFTT